MGLLRAELLQENAVRASTVYPLRDVVSVRSPVLILTTKDDGGIILIALNCQCEAFETLGAQQSEGMPVSRRGSDELVLRRFPEVEVSAVAGPSINGASASFKSRRHDCGFIVNLPGVSDPGGQAAFRFHIMEVKMSENMVTREEFLMELNTERRITMLEAMTAEVRKETAEIRKETAELRAEVRKETAELRTSNEDARKEYRSHQRFVLRVTAAMVIAVVLTFSGIGYNAFSVNQSLAELTIKVDRIDDRLASVETDVAALQTDVAALQTDVAALTVGQQQIFAALRNEGIIQ